MFPPEHAASSSVAAELFAQAPSYSAYSGYAHLGAGLTVGMSSLAAGLAIGIVGEAGVRANAQQPRLFVGMILILCLGCRHEGAGRNCVG